MKKVLVYLGILCLLVFSLSCGGSGEAPADNAIDQPTEATGTAAEEAAPAGEESQSLTDQAGELAGDAADAAKEAADKAGDAVNDVTK